jgi:hypothetical protein
MKRTICLAFVLAAPALLLGDEKPGCPMGPFDLRSPRVQQAALYHSMSVAAEAVAPSTHRRAVAPPSTTVIPPVVNFIDSDLFSAMTKDGVAPTKIASDEEFLRRVSIDLTGQIPDTAAATAFTNDTSADKRTKKIDELLASDAFVDRWTMWLGDLVQNTLASTNIREYYQGRNAYYTYIHDSIKNAKPYDQIVREILAGKGDSWSVGNANYWVRQVQNNGPIQDTYDNLAAHSGEKFLGMPLLCLSCHNGLGHLELVNNYLKNKTRYDFWGDAAFFSRTTAQRIRNADPNNPNAFKFDVEDNNPIGSYRLNTDSGNKSPRVPLSDGTSSVTPAFILTGEKPRTGEAYRDAYGRILTAHPQFARATVNYLWKEMFGLGIVEPTNAFDLNRLDPNNLPSGQTLQPTNASLLTDLTNEFIKDGYSLRAILRTMVISNAYQLSSTYTPAAWNEVWTPYFARHMPHRLTAEEMMDAIAKSTSVPVSFVVTGLGTVTQAMKLPDTLEGGRNNYGRFMDEFGRGNRDDQMRTNDTSIAQALSLMNDSQVVVNRTHKATAGSTVAKILASTTDTTSIATQLYIATLSRKPTATELTQAVAYLKGGNLNQRTEDLQWVLLNSLEFLFD